jgi:integrase
VRTGFFEVEVFQAVVKQLPVSRQPVVTFAYITGWRKEKVLALTWRQVDFKAEVVRIEAGTTKNGEGRTVFMTAELKDLLEDQWAMTMAFERQAGQIIPWVFHRNGKPIRSFNVAWQGAWERAGPPGRLFRDFRRTAVRNMVRAGIPERVAM